MAGHTSSLSQLSIGAMRGDRKMNYQIELFAIIIFQYIHFIEVEMLVDLDSSCKTIIS